MIKFNIMPVMLCLGVIFHQTAHANRPVFTNGPPIQPYLMKKPYSGPLASKAVWETGPSYNLRQSNWPDDVGTYFNQNPSKKKGSVNRAGLKNGPNISPVLMSASEELKSRRIFERMKKNAASYSSQKNSARGVIVGNILKNGQLVDTWTANLNTGEVYEGKPRAGLQATTTFTVEDEVLHKIATGKMNPPIAVMTGKMILGGDLKVLPQLLKKLRE